LQFYLIAGALRLARWSGWLSRPWRGAFLEWDPVDFPRVFMAGRSVSALAGILTLGLVFLLGKRLRDAETGMLAAALVAASPLHVVMSHFLTSDVTMVLVLSAALYWFVISLEEKGVKPVLLGGVFLGLAIAAKYNAAALLPLWPARDLMDRSRSWKQKAAGYAAMVAGFALGEPYGLVHPRELAGAVYKFHLAPNPAAAPYLLGWPELLLAQMKALGYYGFFVAGAALAAAGVVACFLRPNRKRVALAAAALLVAASLVAARWPLVRYTLPLVPIGALAAASVIPRGWSARRRLAASVLLVAPPLVFSAAHVAVLCREHPGNLARAWIDAHVPAGSRVGQIWSELPPLDLTRYDVRLLHPFPHERETVQDPDADYLVLANLPLSPWSDAFAARLQSHYELAAEFRSDPEVGPWTIPEPAAPHDWKYTHPVVRIYRKHR
jgi:4-amino-4-deoxy-L-arabinose transferase-like glycosyltransferase